MTKRVFKGSVMLNPVPVVLITSRNKENIANVFTVAWIGTACTKPPMITVAIRPERLSYEYIKESMEFTVNLPSKDLVRAVDFCGVRSGRQTDKIKELGLTLEDASIVNAPIIKQCAIALECKVKNITPLGSHDLFLAEVVAIQVEDRLMDANGKMHLENADLISYSHGEYFPLGSKALGKFGFSIMKKVKKGKHKK